MQPNEAELSVAPEVLASKEDALRRIRERAENQARAAAAELQYSVVAHEAKRAASLLIAVGVIHIAEGGLALARAKRWAERRSMKIGGPLASMVQAALVFSAWGD